MKSNNKKNLQMLNLNVLCAGSFVGKRIADPGTKKFSPQHLLRKYSSLSEGIVNICWHAVDRRANQSFHCTFSREEK